MALARLVVAFVYCIQTEVFTVPPDRCFANFRWDDCGKPPVPVMYYWKPGSRCEVGFWRGCLPSLNMFDNFYECVQTCIFIERAQPEDFHNILNVTEFAYEDEDITTTEDSNDTSTAVTSSVTNTGTDVTTSETVTGKTSVDPTVLTTNGGETGHTTKGSETGTAPTGGGGTTGGPEVTTEKHE